IQLKLKYSFLLSIIALTFCYNKNERFYLRDEFMRLAEKRVIALVDHDFEDLDLWYPILRLQEEGALVHLIGPHAKETYIGKHGVPATSDFGFKDLQASAGNYDGILVPGGWAP